MSRQKGSFGFVRELLRWDLTIKHSKTAGISKYPTPHQSEREIQRRLRQMGKVTQGDNNEV